MTQLGELQRELETFRTKGATLVAISVDGIDRALAVRDRLSLGYPVLSDPDLAVIRQLGIEDAENGIAWPAIFVIDQSSRVRWRDLTEDYRQRPAPAKILAALDARN